MLTESRAIVLQCLKLGEQKMIVDMLTEQEGRVSFVVRASRPGARPRGRMSKGQVAKQLLQPMTLLDISYERRPIARLQPIGEAHLCMPYTSIPFDARKLSIALFLAEFLCHATRSEQQNSSLFAYIVNSMQWLDGCQAAFSNFHLVFLMRLTRFVGFFPNTDDYAEGDCFDLRASNFCHTAPMHTDFLQPADAARINTLMRMNYDSMHLFRMSHTDRNRIVDVLLHYYRLHVPNFPELRSLPVLKELWAVE